ncbi:unnamed protein product [Symbiodinium natans]|uniref:EF-hand domain-containing protein n=1 Tax=Symbiodinium natans TaxID=878477 RepID=A0A812SZG0_9DINO|nr:unnamed protein product [Symbiodinium natans]
MSHTKWRAFLSGASLAWLEPRAEVLRSSQLLARRCSKDCLQLGPAATQLPSRSAEKEAVRRQQFPGEPFVDSYLEQIYPSNYVASPHSAVTTKLLPSEAGSRASSPQLGSGMRAGSANSRSSCISISSQGSSSWKMQLKGSRQKLLERFCTTKRAFDAFLGTIRELKRLRYWTGDMLDVELPQEQFCAFLTKHFKNIPKEDHTGIFRFFDTDGSGEISLGEFYAVIEAMSPVRCLADLRCRWIALGYGSACRAMELMAPRANWASRRYNSHQFGYLLSKVGVLEWEEHLYIFSAVAAPNMASTVSLAELYAALSSVSPCLLLEEWRQRLETIYADVDKAYDPMEDIVTQAPLDQSKFVAQAGEHWNMSVHEAKRFFRLCDYDLKGKMTRKKFLTVLKLVKPTLRMEHLRSKLRLFYAKVIRKVRSVNKKASLESLAMTIVSNFLQYKQDPKISRKVVPDDFQRTYDVLQLTEKDTALLFSFVDLRGSGKPDPIFWHMLKNFSPSVVLEDLSVLSSTVATTALKHAREAQKLPAWQARHLGLNRNLTPELQAWSELVDGSRESSLLSASVPGLAAMAAASRKEAAMLAPLAAISCGIGGGLGTRPLAEASKHQLRLPEARITQVLSEVYGELAGVEVKASSLLDLLEDSSSQGIPRHSPVGGISIPELAAMVGCAAAADGIPADVSSEGREARAQLEARAHFGPFTDFAVDLREEVRERVRIMGLPKPLPMGSLEEPLSYLNASSKLVDQVSAEEPLEIEGARITEAISEKLETLKLVKDDSLRESLSAEVCAEETANLVLLQQTSKTSAVQHVPAGSEQWRSFYQLIEDCSSYTPDIMMMNNMKSYFLDMGGLVEDQEAMLAKKQRFSQLKRLRTAPSLGSLQ